jgi:ATP-binding cassette subfamily F protein uup
MSTLISAYQISMSFSGKTLFKNLNFSVHENERIGLIGPNGAGKSTLLKILAQKMNTDVGKVTRANHLQLAYLDQNPELNGDQNVIEFLLNSSLDPYESDNIALAYELISKLDLDSPQAGSERPLKELSGGWQKRVSLAGALMKRPNLLILDEPTNHLDVESIQWLEEFLNQSPNLAVLTVTHDRLFLENTCEVIIELNPRYKEGLLRVDGTYADYLDQQTQAVNSQMSTELKRTNDLRRETAWLRRGAKARQTKQKARIERADDLKNEVEDLQFRNRDRRVNIDFGEVGRTPKKIFETQNLGKLAQDRWLFRNFDFILKARSRVGLIGTNGCGKTTLIRTLLGQVPPDEGTVQMTEGVSFSFFEQKKQSLKPGLSVLKTICPEGDYVINQGKPIFAKSYLAQFHFLYEQMDLPVEKLSGGEKTRLLMAQMMLQTNQVLILDEPTNDLDIPTLDTLQASLQDFPGALIMVSHDRYFLDQVCDELYYFSPSGKLEKFSDLFQWQTWIQTQKVNKGSKNKAESATATTKAAPKKLSFKEQHELDHMEANIHAAELLLTNLQSELGSPAIQSQYTKIQAIGVQIDEQQKKIASLYERWQKLSEKKGL